MQPINLIVVGIVLVLGINSALASFSSALYNEVAHDKSGENVIISPASIKTCLGLAYMGAEGETASELYNVLQLTGGNKDEVGAMFGAFAEKIEKSGAELKTANRIYLANDYNISPKYKELTTKYFKSEAENVNFGDQGTAAKINAWVEQQTNNKIKEAIPTGGLDPSSAAVLVNAIYFKATWKYKFTKGQTVDNDFHLTATKKVPVQTMHQTLKLKYGDFPDLDASAIEIPYDNTDISMLVLLPKKIDGLADLEKKLNQIDLMKLELSEQKIQLQFPKFRIEFGTSLNSPLKKLGLTHLFSNGDFSGITESKDPLKVSEVTHKAFIEVDENGTEAAGVTTVWMMRTAPSMRDLPLPFVVDHPFFFAIKDGETVYFAGHISKF